MRKTIRMIICLMLTVSMLGVVNVSALTSNIEVKVNGVILEEGEVFIKDGVSYVNSEIILNGLGNGGFDWLNTNKLSLNVGEETFLLEVNKKDVDVLVWNDAKGYVKVRTIKMAVAPVLKNGIMFLPFRAVVELIYSDSVNYKYENGKHKITAQIKDYRRTN